MNSLVHINPALSTFAFILSYWLLFLLSLFFPTVQWLACQNTSMLFSNQTFILDLDIFQMRSFEQYIFEGFFCSSQVRDINFVKLLLFEMIANFSCLLNSLLRQFAWVLPTHDPLFVLLSLPMTCDEKLKLYFF